MTPIPFTAVKGSLHICSNKTRLDDVCRSCGITMKARMVAFHLPWQRHSFRRWHLRTRWGDRAPACRGCFQTSSETPEPVEQKPISTINCSFALITVKRTLHATDSHFLKKPNTQARQIVTFKFKSLSSPFWRIYFSLILHWKIWLKLTVPYFCQW